MRTYKVTVAGFGGFSEVFEVESNNKPSAKSAAKMRAREHPKALPGRFCVTDCVRA